MERTKSIKAFCPLHTIGEIVMTYKTSERKKAWLEKNKEKHRLYNKQQYLLNKDKRLSNSRRRNKEDRVYLIEYLGERCSVRGCNSDELEIDHINGGGRYERRVRFRNSRFIMYRYYRNNLEEAKAKLRVLCKYHNSEKRVIMGECGCKYWTYFMRRNLQSNIDII